MNFKLWLERKSEFEILKSNKSSLDGEEKERAIKAGCVWHFGNLNKPTYAIWKTKDTSGNVWYVSNTHQAYDKSKTLSQAITNWHKKIEPSS